MNDDPQARQTWHTRLAALWPAMKGSLAKVYKPCIRPNCPACARGDKHPAWLLSVSFRGRRRTMYVPWGLVPTMQKALHNGRKIEQLLSRTGPQLLADYRRRVKKASTKDAKS